MKELFNTLRTKKQILDFLNEYGEIAVVYNYVSNESELYDVHNVKEIICTFGCVVTKMNKFFFNSLLSVASPSDLLECTGNVVVQFEFINRADEIITRINKLTEEAKKDVERYENKIYTLKCEKYFMDCLKGRVKYTDKFIEALKSDEEFVESALEMSIYMCNGWYDNSELKDILKTEYRILKDCYSTDNDFNIALDYYKTQYEKSLELIS